MEIRYAVQHWLEVRRDRSDLQSFLGRTSACHTHDDELTIATPPRPFARRRGALSLPMAHDANPTPDADMLHLWEGDQMISQQLKQTSAMERRLRPLRFAPVVSTSPILAVHPGDVFQAAFEKAKWDHELDRLFNPDY
jgi:hypothetical protein